MDDLGNAEDEIAFLLRLKPAPTPPVRRKVGGRDTSTPSRKWDVFIEQHSDVESDSHRASPVVGKFACSGNEQNYRNLNFRGSLDQNLSPVMGRRLSVDEDPNSLYANQIPPPLPPRWQPTAPPNEDDIQMFPKPAHVSSEGNWHRVFNNHHENNRGNIHFHHQQDAWCPGRGFDRAPLSPPPGHRSFNPSFMEIQSPQHVSTAATYSNESGGFRHPTRNSIPFDTDLASGKPPFVPAFQQKTSRPPKPSPRNSMVREVQGAHYDGGNGRNSLSVSSAWCLE